MTLKIERICDSRCTSLRLIGRIRGEDLDELKSQMERNRQQLVLDLKGVTLVDVEAVRFLETCEAEGIELLHCSRFVREWILRERVRHV
jgi:anti-anti-sigma regulatory factor